MTAYTYIAQISRVNIEREKRIRDNLCEGKYIQMAINQDTERTEEDDINYNGASENSERF